MNAIRERAYGNSNYNFSSVTLDDVLDEEVKSYIGNVQEEQI